MLKTCNKYSAINKIKPVVVISFLILYEKIINGDPAMW